MITIHALPVFDDNYIWLIGQSDSPYVAIVDPGDGDAVLAHCAAKNLTPVAILITHHHWDHTNGIDVIKQQFDIPVYGPANEDIKQLNHTLVEGDAVTIEKLGAHFEVIDTPGHTAGHICYYGHESLFCGDVLFAGGCGRVFEGTAEQMQHALEKIRQLPRNTLIYCAHEYTQDNLIFARVAEPHNQATVTRQQQVITMRSHSQATVPSLLSDEVATNPFLRWDNPQLIKAAEVYSNKPLKSPTDVFAAVRQWKDDLD